MSIPALPPIGLETMGEVHDLQPPDDVQRRRMTVTRPGPGMRTERPCRRPESTTSARLGGCVLLGLAAGHRSMAPLAVLALASRGSAAGSAAAAALAITELVVDKLSFVPPRNGALPSLVRALSGALAGAIAARRSGVAPFAGVALGAVAATAATRLGLQLRLASEERMPPLIAAVAEDLLALALALVGASLTARSSDSSHLSDSSHSSVYAHA